MNSETLKTTITKIRTAGNNNDDNKRTMIEEILFLFIQLVSRMKEGRVEEGGLGTRHS